ncbi:hypothetical protein ACFL6I_17350, partial [candidate division KSB1 bacterium]
FGGAAAGVLGLLDVPVAGQIAVFIIFSGILIVFEKRFFDRYRFKKPDEMKLGDDYGANAAALQRSDSDEPYENVFRKSGPGWEIRYGGKSYSVKDSIGLVHIRNLIIREGDWLSGSDLRAMSAHAVLHDSTKPYSRMSNVELENENLRNRVDILPEDLIGRLPLNKLKDLRNELAGKIEADDFNNPEEKIEQRELLEFLNNHIKSVTDRTGRSRKILHTADTDRKAVSAAINRCRSSFMEHEELYTHFKSFIKAEGNAFRYLPDRNLNWKTS